MRVNRILSPSTIGKRTVRESMRGRGTAPVSVEIERMKYVSNRRAKSPLLGALARIRESGSAMVCGIGVFDIRTGLIHQKAAGERSAADRAPYANGSDWIQNRAFKENCTCRGELLVELIVPKLGALRTLFGCPKIGVFVKLNASARNSIVALSPIGKCRNSERSRFLVQSVRSEFRPRLPKV